jgi:hypothetical protein
MRMRLKLDRLSVEMEKIGCGILDPYPVRSR